MASDRPVVRTGKPMIGAVFPRRNHDISPNLALPAMSRIRVGQTLISCSTGFDRATMIRAAGEALERQLAFADRAGSAEQPMAIDQFDPDVLEWINLHSADQPDPPTELLASFVKELGTGRTRRFPSVAFALGPHIDTEHFPKRDSSGSAFHQSAEMARSAALAELCERQALTAFWYGGYVRKSFEIGPDAPIGVQLSRCCAIMRNAGQLLVVDISLIRPYRVYLAFILNRDGPVYLASGASAHQDGSRAMEKALLELWQAYVLMQQLHTGRTVFELKSEKSLGVTDDYFSHNTADTVARLYDMLPAVAEFSTDAFAEPMASFTLEDLKVLLSEQRLDFPGLSMSLHLCQTVALNGFLTMSSYDSYPTATRSVLRSFNLAKVVNTEPVPFG